MLSPSYSLFNKMHPQDSMRPTQARPPRNNSKNKMPQSTSMNSQVPQQPQASESTYNPPSMGLGVGPSFDIQKAIGNLTSSPIADQKELYNKYRVKMPMPGGGSVPGMDSRWYNEEQRRRSQEAAKNLMSGHPWNYFDFGSSMR